ncbi:MAG: hypothetical protein H3C31_07620 [Brumimicrobium sp.]|nr:hypothetical protein [Brumimicrobium sp.]MCO5267947.1 hypothetical protein [Brumimicrobium sp.]
MKKDSYLEKLKKLFKGKIPASFKLHIKYNEYSPSEKEDAAESYFKLMMMDPVEKKKAKELGLI